MIDGAAGISGGAIRFYIGLAGGNPLSHICNTWQESAAGPKNYEKIGT